MELNNPLRPSVKPLKTEKSSTSIESSPKEDRTKATPAIDSLSSTRIKNHSDLSISTSPPLTVSPQEGTSLELHPEVRKMLEALNAPEEFKKLMVELSRSGIEIAGPRKVYLKHSYEIEKDLHTRFHEMYPVLGFKKVKDAINDAITKWCDQNETEFQRRNQTQK